MRLFAFYIQTISASNKKLQRLKLSICPRGIETFDAITGETLHRISIYKISYCSADAAHSNVFAFIAGTPAATIHDYVGPDDTDELTCYAFICAKRKIAHSLTITVAKNFERAYELWKNAEQRKTEPKCELDRLNGEQTLPIKSNHHLDELNCNQNDNRKNLLIDFNSDACDDAQANVERQRQILQTRWVSFDDEPLMNGNHNANNDGNDDDDMQPKVFANNLWDVDVMCS